jgi:hypothetical protein
VATGPAGYRHLSKGGFLPMEAPQYLGKYDLMRIDATTARSHFWKQIFGVPPSAPAETAASNMVLSVPVVAPRKGRIRAGLGWGHRKRYPMLLC